MSAKINRPPSPEFRKALALAYRDSREPQPKCADKPELYSDYDVPPSPEGQQRLCGGCPLLALCGKSAAYSRPSWGIHAGVAWSMGRRYRGEAEESRDSEESEDYPDMGLTTIS